MALQKDTHCSYCGRPFATGQVWPRHCAACGQVTYQNPLPVAVLLVPVGKGLLLIRRGIEPGAGRLALPGGYVNLGETWQQAAVRELAEETGIRVRAGQVELFRVWTSTDRAKLVVFGVAPRQPAAVVERFRPSAEATECVVAAKPRGLAFSLHVRAMKEYFAP
jgi:ADP-ribose pyrophosphatase YjhB (NUDIX family)